VFLEKLLCGHIDCSFLGFGPPPKRLDPKSITFEPNAL